MVDVIHAAFGARPPLDPPSTAILETAETVTATMLRGGAIYARVADRPAGVILVTTDPSGAATFQRVSVHPDFQRHGIASAMVDAAEELAATLGCDRVELFARGEFAELIAFWQHRGFRVDRDAPYGVILVKRVPAVLQIPTGEAMQQLGARLADLLRAGDMIIASGDLGAGKTTLTQGIGSGLGSVGPIISPTFVLSRVHASTTGRPRLVHVDAYRLSSPAELDDLDLDATVPDSVTVVEWGAGLAEGLTDSRLEIDLRTVPSAGAGEHDGRDASPRRVLLRGVGERWRDIDLQALQGSADDD
jgi:tRNA threonylcarbamoyladenosine biosynthesis protein TsaE